MSDGIPGWLPMKGGPKRYRCDECGEVTTKPGWAFFATLTVSTRCVCEECVELLVGDE